MNRFQDKVAIVTGATSGIGAAIASALYDEGAKIVACGTDRAKLAAFAVKKGPWVTTVRAPFGLADSEKWIVDSALKAYGRLDILINAAGILRFGGVVETRYDDWLSMMQINLLSPAELIALSAAPLTLTRGCIVNISSINATRPFKNVAAYNVSKAALDHLTRSAAADLAPDVRVNAVNPGVVLTNLHKRAGMSDADYQAFIDRCGETHPLGRAGQVDDVVPAVLFLASDEARWITGVTLPVDGGRHLTVLR